MQDTYNAHYHISQRATSDAKNMGNTEEPTTADIPVHVYIIMGLVVASLLGTQLMGLWMAGFKKPTKISDTPDFTEPKNISRSPTIAEVMEEL
ncbi:hypothetical protein QBC35DRAFT_446864 [Podospora australis]|uniref:Uncharacterized protein n=1 Tax=Podospora australis TaxID=1536484 RepID=A0AAN7AMZ1_9PEZI|nr:hypothetical protein QBC35DRAFT_446864 [Podospora australis]